MKKTVWDIDDGITTVEYHHESGEIFIRQDVRHSYGGKVVEVNLIPDDMGFFMTALGELKVILDAEKIEKTLGEVA